MYKNIAVNEYFHTNQSIRPVSNVWHGGVAFYFYPQYTEIGYLSDLHLKLLAQPSPCGTYINTVKSSSASVLDFIFGFQVPSGIL